MCCSNPSTHQRVFNVQISPYIATSMHFNHQRHLCLSVLCAETLCHTDGHVWSAKRRQNTHLLSYLGEEMWPNCLKYRPDRPMPCVGFLQRQDQEPLTHGFSGDVRESAGRNARCKQNRGVKERRGSFTFIFLMGWAVALVMGPILTLANAPILTFSHGVTLHH